jgi:thioredoxin reductase
MHGYLSRDGLPPADLVAFGQGEVTSYGGEIAHDTVTGIERSHTGGFEFLLGSGLRVTARRLLVATGLRDELPDVKGLTDRWARDVLHCPYCHGWEVRDQRLAVLCDGSPESVMYAHIVRQWSDDIVVIVAPRTLTREQRVQFGARAIAVVEGAADQVLVENDHLVGIQLDDGRVIGRDAVFVPPRFVPNNDLLTDLGCELAAGWVVKDPTGATTTPGVWVAGNVANPRAQVITAAGEGSAAAIAINADLVSEDVRIATEAT